MRRSLTILSILLVLWQGPANAETQRELSWDQLVPAGEPIEDTLADLSPDQRMDLEILASIKAEQALDRLSDVSPQAEIAIEIEEKLRRDGPDVDALLERFAKLEAEVRKRNSQMVADLDGRLVRIPGYALPLEFDGASVEEFLLVPYVGACIHVPPPPKNQMVFVRLNQSFPANSLYEPVWITGRMKVQGTTKTLTYVDGQTEVEAGYTLDAFRVEPYEE